MMPDVILYVSLECERLRGMTVSRRWQADRSATFRRRWGKSSQELGQTSGNNGCPDMWELSNGDVAVIGQDLTAHYMAQLPEGPDTAKFTRNRHHCRVRLKGADGQGVELLSAK